VTGDDTLAVLDHRLHELRERDKLLLEIQINLEKTTAGTRTVSNTDNVQAENLLEGGTFKASRDSPISQSAR